MNYHELPLKEKLLINAIEEQYLVRSVTKKEFLSSLKFLTWKYGGRRK